MTNHIHFLIKMGSMNLGTIFCSVHTKYTKDFNKKRGTVGPVFQGRPIDNAFLESIHGKFRDECLDQHWFERISDAQQIIEAWREEYNHHRPHSSLNYQTPMEYAQTLG